MRAVVETDERALLTKDVGRDAKLMQVIVLGGAEHNSEYRGVSEEERMGLN